MDTASIVAVAGALSGIVLGWTGKSRIVRQDTAAETREDTTIKMNVEYIKTGIDDVRLTQKDQGRQFEALAERVTRVEESTKQAHHRINEIKK